MEKQLQKIFLRNGLEIQPDEFNNTLDMDSIQFISIIVAIEEEFNIEIPDEFLAMGKLKTFCDFFELIKTLL